MPDNPININPQPIPANLPGNMDKLGGDEGSSNPTDTAEQNYTLVGMGNDHGQITLGQIDKEGEVLGKLTKESFTRADNVQLGQPSLGNVRHDRTTGQAMVMGKGAHKRHDLSRLNDIIFQETIASVRFLLILKF